MNKKINGRKFENLTFEQMKDRILSDICYALDAEVYLPVKEELSKTDVQYSLGIRKEDFKGIMEHDFEFFTMWAIENAKTLRDYIMGGTTYGKLPSWVKKLNLNKEAISGIVIFLMDRFKIKEEDLHTEFEKAIK